MATEQLKVEDVAGVRSRISWQAVLSGAILAVATNFVLTLFFAAVGLTMAEQGVRAGNVGTAALIAALVSIVVSLFIGGWASTQLTAGENEREAVLYGILTWALVVGFSLAIVGMGARAGYFALVGGSMIGSQSPALQQRVEAGLNAAQARAEQAQANPPTQEQIDQAERAAVGASWAALVGVMLSMAACIIGAMCGRGVAFRLLPVARSTAVVQRREIAIS